LRRVFNEGDDPLTLKEDQCGANRTDRVVAATSNIDQSPGKATFPANASANNGQPNGSP